MAKSYYKVIDGKRYDREMLELAEKGVAGKGDGRISVDDAKKLYEAIIDGNVITETERDTLKYIEENFRFTEAAANWLNEALETWKKEKEKPVSQTEVEEASRAESEKTIIQAEEETVSQTAVEEPVSPSAPEIRAARPAPAEGKQMAVQAPVRKNRGLLWPVLAGVFLILIPVAFFIGKGIVEKSYSTTEVESLQKTLLIKEQEIAALKSEVKRLNTALAQSKKTVQEVRDNRLELAEALERGLSDEFSSSDIQFDKEKLIVAFVPEKVFFEIGDNDLDPSLENLLGRFFPKLIHTLKEGNLEVVEIQFQGHSSSGWKYAKSAEEAYLKNMRLSVARAEAALKYCLGLAEIQPDKSWLNKRVVAAGFSDSRPALGQDNEMDEVRSRGITISVR